MNISLFLARRFLWGNQGRLLGAVSKLALTGIAIGVAALVVAMGLMSGYRNELAEKLAGTNAEVLVVPPIETEEPGFREKLAELPGVLFVARTAFAPGLVLSRAAPSGIDVMVKGIEIPSGLSTTRLLARVPDLPKKLAPKNPENRAIPALFGIGLARRLGAREGDTLVLETATLSMTQGVAPPRRSLLSVEAIVETGFSEVDDGWAVVPLSAFEEVAPPDARQGLWELKLEKPSESEKTVEAARKAVGPLTTVLDWKALNRDLFEALAMQQTLLFVGLALIVAVAAGTVISALVVLLAAKTREAGVLAALGAPPRQLARTIRYAGLLLGGAGLAIGIVFGLLVCWLMTVTRAVRFPPEIAKVYYLTWLPFKPEPLHILGIAVVGGLLVWAASLMPARRAKRMKITEALRYE
ncbi:MAG: ABC transporter permease [Acidobacteria bacterium]|nr:ABC transporter permease [Acidobacteriota bacterium]MCG3193375.1 Lipoprotein-releasing system transmembrane protein LolE [Thermoanaerobaculia bacterium]MCK6685911.1 FtsX-like permease family protein [Thermoanaerobaculia bacterium]